MIDNVGFWFGFGFIYLAILTLAWLYYEYKINNIEALRSYIARHLQKEELNKAE